VNAIAPGVFPSRMTKFGLDNNAFESVGSVRHMAGLSIFLCSRASDHITGAVIPIDGGFTLSETSYARI
jgi:NAD(P)-dependent dehydrogenase (short-subunit alcohol dehydrogenase family)